MNIIGEKVRELRKSLDLAQVDLCAALRVEQNIELDRSDISEIERGVRGVKDYELKALASVLNTTPHALLNWGK